MAEKEIPQTALRSYFNKKVHVEDTVTCRLCKRDVKGVAKAVSYPDHKGLGGNYGLAGGEARRRRARRGAESTEGVGCGEGAVPPPQKIFDFWIWKLCNLVVSMVLRWKKL